MAPSMTPHPVVVIEQVWQVITAHFANGPLEVVLPMDLKPFLGDGGIQVIARRFSAFISAPIAVFFDQAINVVRMAPTSQVQGTHMLLYHASAYPGTKVDTPQLSAQTAGVSKKGDMTQLSKQDKVPRPPNPFILYRQHHHPLLKQMHPEMHNNEISVILGNQWNSESEEVKNRYKDLANAIKEEHQKNYPDYQYQPRKPSEKKRRSTRRKAVALQDSPDVATVSDDTGTIQATSSGAATVSDETGTIQATGSGTAKVSDDTGTIQATGSGAATVSDDTGTIQATGSGTTTVSDETGTFQATGSGAAMTSGESPTFQVTAASDVPDPVVNHTPQAASVGNTTRNTPAAVTESTIVEQQNNEAANVWTPVGSNALSAEIQLDMDDVALYQMLTDFNRRVPTPPAENAVPVVSNAPVATQPSKQGVYDEKYIYSLVNWNLFEDEVEEIRQGVIDDYHMFGDD